MRFIRRRPSPAIVISCVALFMSLGGVGYAAVVLPANSVGTAQLQPQSVTYSKIMPGAVGNVRANVRQLQERVWKSCAANTAMNHIARNGDPTCGPTLPAEFGTTDNTAHGVGGTAVTVTQVALPTGTTYLALADPEVTVTPASGVTSLQHTTATCKLTVGSNTETRSVTIDTSGGSPETVAIPLQAAGGAGTGLVSCTSATTPTGPSNAVAPTVDITSTINALQTASNS